VLIPYLGANGRPLNPIILDYPAGDDANPTQYSTAGSSIDTTRFSHGALVFMQQAAVSVVTELTNGYSGKEVSLLVENSNTTFQHNSQLRMKGGVNYAVPSGTVVTFKCLREPSQGDVWYEIARSG
jgi:hypothetical protein